MEVGSEPIVAGRRHDPHATLAQPRLHTGEVLLRDEVELDRPLVLLGIRRMGQQAQLRGAEAEQRATSPSRLPWTTCAPTAW